MSAGLVECGDRKGRSSLGTVLVVPELFLPFQRRMELEPLTGMSLIRAVIRFLEVVPTIGC